MAFHITRLYACAPIENKNTTPKGDRPLNATSLGSLHADPVVLPVETSHREFRDLRSRWSVPKKGYSTAEISGGHH
jgi:hypothetical protein